MISINSINLFPISSLQFKNKPIATASATTRNAVIRSVQKASLNPLEPFSNHPLPEGTVNEMTDIIRRIGANAHQAAELEQSLKNRVLLQSKIAKDILNLKTVFEEFSQDDRKLFTALFQNQLPPGPAFSDSNQDSFINSFPLDGFVNSFPENFFGIDVTSKFGSLSAFNITSNAIEILSGRNSGKNLLEFLLDNLTKSIFNFPGIKNSEQDQNGFKTIQNLDIARLLAQSTYFSRTTADSNPLTIIDLVG